MPQVKLWYRLGKTKDDVSKGEWMSAGVHRDARKAKDTIPGNRAVFAKTGHRYSEFKITKPDETP